MHIRVTLLLLLALLLTLGGCSPAASNRIDTSWPGFNGASFEEAQEVYTSELIGSRIKDHLSSDFTGDPEQVRTAFWGEPFQIMALDLEKQCFTVVDDTWYCPIILDGEVLAMGYGYFGSGVDPDATSLPVFVGGMYTDGLTEALKNSETSELFLFSCQKCVYALDTSGQLYEINHYPGETHPVFPENLADYDGPWTDFSAVIGTVADYLPDR